MKNISHNKRTLWIVGAAAAAVLLAMLVLMVLPGNGEPESTEPETVATQEPTETIPETELTEPSETEATEPEPTEPEPTEPEYLSYNPLTGEGLFTVSENRPYAVVFNNIQAAQPQYGVGSADILCEILVEGTTRCLGIYYDISDVEVFGSIRSARPYLLRLAQSFDAILVHAGRSDECQSLFKSTGWDHLDGVHGSGASAYYYRDKTRLNAGYALEHTLFISSESVTAYAEKLKCTLTRSGGVDYGWSFIEGSAAEDGEAATSVTVKFNRSKSGSGKITSFAYNAEDGLYYASQYGSEYVDAATGEQLSFRNLVILKAKTVSQGDSSGHLTITLTGSGSGYYVCDGKLISIQWSRATETSPFVFTTEDGEALELSVGQTYMGIIPTKGTVTYQ